MEKVIKFKELDVQRTLFGPRDRYLRMIRDHYQVRCSVRNSRLKLEGDAENVLGAHHAIITLTDLVRMQRSISLEDVEGVIYGLNVPDAVSADDWTGGDGEVTKKRSSLVEPMTDGQSAYIQAIQDFDVVFGIGPAGPGKTFLATAQAVEALHKRRVRRIVLVRPAVEAGEKLGFLPGDMQAKVNPYLRPIFDALGALLDYNALRRYMERDVIEIAPLAFMRGRTLDSSFIILDEAQNTTPKQMLMLLTRFGRNSKVVVTGDITQVDLEGDNISGLVDAERTLRDVDGIRIVKLTERDIVRHSLVQKIVAAYDERSILKKLEYEKKKARKNRASKDEPEAEAENESDESKEK